MDSNLKQQGPLYNRRSCQFYKPNSILIEFDKINKDIIRNYQKKAEDHMLQSLAILVDKIRNGAKQPEIILQPNSQNVNYATIAKFSQKRSLPNLSNMEAINEQEQTPEKQLKKMLNYQKTGQKQLKSTKKIQFCVEEHNKKIINTNTKKYQKLVSSLEKLSVTPSNSNSDDLLYQQLENELENMQNNSNQNDTNFEKEKKEDQPQYSNAITIDEELMKKKTLTELLQQSEINSKRMQGMSKFDSSSSSQSEYEITDHSSNESSQEENNYEERYAYQGLKYSKPKNQQLFGGIFPGNKLPFSNQLGKNQGLTFMKFGKGQQSSLQHPPHPNLNFKPLLDSPKKSKTKRKRLYINRKKVPKWAEDLKEVAKQYQSEYQQNLRSQRLEIFGECIIQNLQTNVLFDRNDEYTRASTAKWERRKDDEYITK